ncbi:MAG TPA: triple tyrosine motif-containing protein, partial [Gemmatimonadaceae bacterium]
TIRLPPGTNRLELEYSALNLTSPLRQHFRYKLEGFDSEWVDAGARRQAFYTNLPPRSYTFRVMTSDAEGSWANAESASLDLSIRPMFYQTTWFVLLSGLGLAAVIAASWRLHVRRVRRQFALLIGERARLSRELHDTLLQSLLGIALQFDAMANDPQVASPDSKRGEFLRMRKRVEQYIRDARQSISDLRSPKLEIQDLATALREAGQREVDGRAIELSFRQSGTPRTYPAGLEEQMLKIGKEAIVNAARHAHADRIEIELEASDEALTLRVIDNGTGFDPGAVAPDGTSHYGLTSMRERAEDIGGRFTILSTAGRGTRIEATVPVQDTPRGKRHAEPALH